MDCFVVGVSIRFESAIKSWITCLLRMQYNCSLDDGDETPGRVTGVKCKSISELQISRKWNPGC